MTRGKWVALGVALAVIAVLVPYGPALWTAVAYEENRMRVTRVFPWGRGSKPDYVIVMTKRRAWLPGPERVTLCAWCVESNHANCPGDMAVANPPRRVGLGRWRDVSERRACDCPHPSHAQESE